MKAAPSPTFVGALSDIWFVNSSRFCSKILERDRRCLDIGRQCRRGVLLRQFEEGTVKKHISKNREPALDVWPITSIASTIEHASQSLGGVSPKQFEQRPRNHGDRVSTGTWEAISSGQRRANSQDGPLLGSFERVQFRLDLPQPHQLHGKLLLICAHVVIKFFDERPQPLVGPALTSERGSHADDRGGFCHDEGQPFSWDVGLQVIWRPGFGQQQIYREVRIISQRSRGRRVYSRSELRAHLQLRADRATAGSPLACVKAPRAARRFPWQFCDAHGGGELLLRPGEPIAAPVRDRRCGGTSFAPGDQRLPARTSAGRSFAESQRLRTGPSRATRTRPTFRCLRSESPAPQSRRRAGGATDATAILLRSDRGEGRNTQRWARDVDYRPQRRRLAVPRCTRSWLCRTSQAPRTAHSNGRCSRDGGRTPQAWGCSLVHLRPHSRTCTG